MRKFKKPASKQEFLDDLGFELAHRLASVPPNQAALRIAVIIASVLDWHDATSSEYDKFLGLVLEMVQRYRDDHARPDKAPEGITVQ